MRTTMSGSAVAAALALVFTTPSAALAASPTRHHFYCDPDSFCAYHGRGGSEGSGRFHHGVWDLGGFNGGRLNDHVWSVFNNTGHTWCLYSDAGYRGTKKIVTRGTRVDLVDGSGRGFGNAVSSLRARPLFGC